MIRLKRTAAVLSQAFGEMDVGYLRKWLVIGGLIGVVSGVGSVVFFVAIEWATSVFLEAGAGLVPPAAGGEGPVVFVPAVRWWMIPVVTTIGGLISGLIVFKLAPEAEGHGTDAAINSFHNKDGFIRRWSMRLMPTGSSVFWPCMTL